MNGYQPIIGSVISLGNISHEQQKLIRALLTLYEKCKRGAHTPGDFAEEGRTILMRSFPERNDFQKTFNRIPGKIYRDCFYRLVLHRSTQKNRPRILRNIRYHPARLLLDRYLAEWGTQYEFSQRLGIDPKILNDWFRIVLGQEKDESKFSVKGYLKVCEKIGIVGGFEIQEHRCEFDPDFKPHTYRLDIEHPVVPIWSSATIRDHLFRTLAGGVVPLILNGEIERPLRLIGFHLAALHGIDDILVLNRYSKIVFIQLRRSLKLKKVSFESGLLTTEIIRSWPKSLFNENSISAYEKWVDSWCYGETVKSL